MTSDESPRTPSVNQRFPVALLWLTPRIPLRLEPRRQETHRRHGGVDHARHMFEVRELRLVVRSMIVVVQIKGRERVCRNTHARERDVVTSLEEALLGPRILDDRYAVRGERIPHRRPLVPREPGFAHAARKRVRAI